jgi:FkbM family methyltransferase
MFKSLEARLKRSPTAVAAAWKWYVWSDWWGTRVWKFKKARNTPYGFRLLAGIHLAYRQMQSGSFEQEEVALVRAGLETADIFVDVGANIGFYTCIALQSGKRVLAIEPQSENLKVLYTNLNMNGWTDVEVYPLGLSDEPGIVTLYGASGPSASLLRNWAEYSDRFRQVIPVSTLDILLGERFRESRLFIKIDVEGAEYQVLQGALNTLRRTPRPTWMIEICLEEYHPAGLNPHYAAIFELFWRHDYEARTADRRSVRICREDVQRWIDVGHCDSGTINYVFSPQSSPGALTPG